MFLAQVVGRRFARSAREGRLEKLKTRRKSKTEGLQDLPKVLWGRGIFSWISCAQNTDCTT